MEEQLINIETAALTKEKGFDIEVCNYFKIITISSKIIEDCVPNKQNFNNISNTIFSRPTQSLLQKWLREVHKIIVLVDWEGTDGYFYKLDFKSFYEVAGNNNKNYEDCLELGLQEALKLI